MKKMYKLKKNQMIGGVCSGLAESLHVDVNVLRLLFVISLFLGGTGILIYITLWFILPYKSKTEILDKGKKQKSDQIVRVWDNRMLAGVCAGISRYTGWDVSLIRLIFVLLSMISGIGIIIYILLAFILPLENKQIETEGDKDE